MRRKKAFLLTAFLSLGALAFPDAALAQMEFPSPEQAAELLRKEKQEAIEAKWMISVDVQMLALPTATALRLLPELQSADASQVDAAVRQLQELLKKKQAVLLGWPRTCAANGQHAVSDGEVENRYPSEFSPPLEPQTFGGPGPKLPLSIVPNSMETRNSGVALEVTPVVRDQENGRRIQVEIYAIRTIPLAFEPYELGRTAEGHFTRIAQPKFAASRIRTTLLMHSGEWVLIGVHMLTSPEDHLEVVIARAVATKTR